MTSTPHPTPPPATATIEEQHQAALAYHPLTPGRAEVHEELRAAAQQFAAVLDRLCPRSREHSLAFTDVQSALMWANAAVAIHDPASQPGRSGDDD